MRGAARYAVFVGAALLALAAVFALFGPAVIGSLIRGALAEQGFIAPSLKVKNAGLSELVIEKLRAGTGAEPDLAVERIKVRYDLIEALTKRRVRTIDIGPGRVVATVDKKGAVRIAGFVVKRQEDQGPLPFNALTIKDLALGLKAPDGAATGALTGDFSSVEGGAFALQGQAARIGAARVIVTGAALSGRLGLAKDGAVTLAAEAKGDAASPLGVARNVVLTLSGGGSSWRDMLAGKAAEFAGRGRIELVSAEIPAAAAPALASVQGFAPFRTLSLRGAAILDARGATTRVTGANGPALTARSDAGDAITIEAADGAPLFVRDATGARLSLAARLSGATTGAARLAAAQKPAGPWTFQSEAKLGAARFGAVALRQAAYAATGTASADFNALTARASLSAWLRRAAIGRFVVEDAPMSARLDVVSDARAKTLVVAAVDDSCVSAQRGRFAIPGEATEAKLTNARLCADGGPLVSARLGDAPHAEIKGRLAASDAFYKIAASTAAGAPPDVRFTADYDPARKTTAVTGTLKGGRIALNDVLLVGAADGQFSGGLNASGLSGSAELTSLIIAHRARPEQFSPIKARGTARLDRDIASFRFDATTPGGKPLGAGAGFHDVAKGRGEAQFATGRLEFSPGGLQISGLLPALRGVVGGATGAVSSDIRAAWAPGADGFTSSGEFRLDDLSFRGPGVAVSRTAGISGVLRLASLAPLKSDGPQSISIKTIDIGALKLEGGGLDFDLPGDETVRLSRGEFPWFGGKIGAYGANAKIGGDSFAVNLRAENVDLKQMLDFLKIPGLSGEGVVEGVLPLVVEGGKSFIRDGEMIATTPGVVRYAGQVTDAAAANNEGAKLAFDLLRELRFQKLGAKIDGPLDGDLKFTIIFEGSNDVVVNDQKVRSPVIYRITLEAPLLALIEQAQVSTNTRLQLERSGVLPEKKVKE